MVFHVTPPSSLPCQDFDDWDDVGLNSPKPPALLQLFRNYSAALLSDKERLQRIQELVSSVVHGVQLLFNGVNFIYDASYE